MTKISKEELLLKINEVYNQEQKALDILYKLLGTSIIDDVTTNIHCKEYALFIIEKLTKIVLEMGE